MKPDDIQRITDLRSIYLQQVARSIVGVQPMSVDTGRIFSMGHNVKPIKPRPKYQFSRAHWYTAEFRWQDQYEVFDWCVDQFGHMDKHPDAWSRWKTLPGNRIAFRDQKDYTWFVLRWSGSC